MKLIIRFVKVFSAVFIDIRNYFISDAFMLSMLGKNFSRHHLEIYILFSFFKKK